MDRDFTAAIVEEVAKPLVRFVHLVAVYFDSYTIRITDADREIEWDGETWLPMGSLLAIGNVEESATITQQFVPLTLSGVDQIWGALFLSQHYLHGRITAHRAYLDERNNAISDPHPLFDRTIDDPVWAEDPSGMTSQITVQAVSHLAGHGGRPGRHTNDSEQQLHFPGDRGFHFVSSISREVPWGGGKT